MAINKILLSGLMALSITGSALAQEQAAEGDAAAATEAPKKIEDELSMGQEVQPTTYVRETVGDWELKCFGLGEEADPCQMYQLLTDESGGSIAEFSLFRLANGTKAIAGATIVVPLETLLTAKLGISVDGSKSNIYDYSHCTVTGCFARIGLTEGDIATFKRGAKAQLNLVPAVNPELKIKVDVSLTGFTAAYDQVSVLKQ